MTEKQAADGKIYQVGHYDLDVVISVGYRVKSAEGIHFRRWANDALKRYVLAGYLPGLTLLRDYDAGKFGAPPGTVPDWQLTDGRARRANALGRGPVICSDKIPTTTGPQASSACLKASARRSVKAI